MVGSKRIRESHPRNPEMARIIRNGNGPPKLNEFSPLKKGSISKGKVYRVLTCSKIAPETLTVWKIHFLLGANSARCFSGALANSLLVTPGPGRFPPSSFQPWWTQVVGGLRKALELMVPSKVQRIWPSWLGKDMVGLGGHPQTRPFLGRGKTTPGP